MKIKIITIGLIISTLTLFFGCKNENSGSNGKEKLKVAVTINVLKDFAEYIGGEKVEVFSIIPDGSDAHNFEPKPNDLKELGDSDIFIYNGLGMEEWIDPVIKTLKDKKTKVLEVNRGVEIIETLEECNHNHSHEEHNHSHGEEHNHSHEEHNHHRVIDPHIWLSLNNAIIEAENIKNIFLEIDSKNKSYYEENFKNFKEEVTLLNNEFKSKFKELDNKNFITGHAAFGYLCKDFGLKQNSISNILGEGELTPKKLEDLVNYCKENKVKTIFSESTESIKESETLAKEIGAKVVKVHTFENNEANMKYIDGMKYNLDTIYNSLKE